MDCPGLSEDTYAFYVLGLLETPDRDELLNHLESGCRTCVESVQRARSLWYSVASSGVQVNPPPRVRRKILGLAGVSERRWWWSPLPMLALAALVCVTFSAGLFSGKVSQVVQPSFSFAPVYSAPELPRAAVSPPPEPKILVKQVETTVVDPVQAKLIETLNQELTRERQKSQQLEADLNRRKTLLAEAPEPATPPSASPETGELRRQLAASAARASDLERQVTQYKVLVEAQRKRLDQTMQIASMVGDPSLRVVRLRATEKDQSVEGHAAIATGSKMVFYASQLPSLPANRTYQLWIVRSTGSAVASAGIFVPDASHAAVLQLQDASLLNGVTALAVTDEPAGGSKSPTGHKWLIGS